MPFRPEPLPSGVKDTKVDILDSTVQCVLYLRTVAIAIATSVAAAVDVAAYVVQQLWRLAEALGLGLAFAWTWKFVDFSLRTPE
jgi:hypothetical protein